MFIVALVGAFIFYVGLYLLWESSQSRLDSTAAILRSINNMLWLPQNTVFTIFRGLLLVAMLYVVGDFIFSAAKRAKRATRRRAEDEENVIRWKKPPRV
ncbi:hypothetical protein B1R32_12814 [Abditibacterium utsteinense]|uniref:Uncharacterized protein n=1 Tax=Abditibacterium utsteinense TaxID=1960156 RepID=A0A2S8SP68_9BACT|nr:hypothetical protein [Abditibacterium utsteinense]PQV62576.1 hypothetical protein B1R32_12814 [Abditibacterium utsteinense]